MRKILPLVLLAYLPAVTTWADTKPPRPPAIKKVSIEKNAAWSDSVSSDESPESCKDFVLTESDVREFFRTARPATSTEYIHDLLMSRCHASGRVVFKDGREAEFRIDRARRGRLRFADMTEWHYFCAKCRSKAYGEACDIDCIHAE